ncbi:MAG: TetR/AcrR family transcriptional regulator [Flavitalea sp.]
MVKKKDDTTEEKILNAAKKIFIKNGMAGARMQDIADEAGINKALLHYYFKNKELLFENIFIKLSTDFWPRLNFIFESDMPLFEKIPTFCNLYMEKLIENPYIPLFVLYEMNRRPAQFFKKMFAGNAPQPLKLMNQIEAEAKAGKIRPIHPSQLVINMISMCIFPFIGKPMIMAVMNMNEDQFRVLIEQRKKDVPIFIIESIKK